MCANHKSPTEPRQLCRVCVHTIKGQTGDTTKKVHAGLAMLVRTFFLGFAFIEFEDPRDAEDSVRDMDGRTVCGVRIRVELAKSTNGRR